jgi:hypothetical protein
MSGPGPPVHGEKKKIVDAAEFQPTVLYCAADIPAGPRKAKETVMPKQTTLDTERRLFKRLCDIVNDAREMVTGITWHLRVPQVLVPPGHKVQGVSAAWEVAPYDETIGDEVPDVSEPSRSTLARTG